MIRPQETALVLLAAGQSRRFGAADKLAEPFLREPLAFHVVTALEMVPFAARYAVVSGTRLDFAARGYRVVANDAPETGRGRSLQLGVDAARGDGPSAILIALADMPRVTASHILHLMEAADGPGSVVASSDGVIPRPPALFGAEHFDALTRASGDSGAVDLIRAGRHVVTSAAELIDIDTRAELDALRARYGVDG